MSQRDPKRFFTLPADEVRTPWQVALEKLLKMDVQEGDTIRQDDISKMLPMVDAKSITSIDEMKAYTLARWPEVESLIEGFETETGLTLMSDYRGSYLVLPREEVASVVFEVVSRKVDRALRWALGKFSRASADGVSQPEMKRRHDAERHLREFQSFMGRTRRAPLVETETRAAS